MNNFNKSILSSLLLALASFPTSATSPTSSPTFKANVTGQLLIDGALYASPQKEEFKDGMAIPEVRLGAKMSYGNWIARIDLGFAYNKVGLKDMFIEYDFNSSNKLRLGSFIHQYGLQSATGASNKTPMEEPVSNTVFNDVRQLGVQYQHCADKFSAAVSAHMEPKATTFILRPNQFTQEGYGLRTRLVAHPLHKDGKVLHFGISGAFATPQKITGENEADPHDSFRFAAMFPTRVTQVNALDATVDHAMNLWKFTPELLLAYERIALESEYYFLQVNRRNNMHNFRGQGAYAMLRGILIGENYAYSTAESALCWPAPKTLEAVACYNYTSLSDPNAGIYGGNLNDLSFTLNYYINKYLTARLHYSYTHTWNHTGQPSKSLNAFMVRLQAIF